ncbi:MAG: (4Fe-4S)-binding protein [Bacteroidales bacterium]|nr:(4Fe-4S)-binding protein [Bacteroidales bacterium]
MDKSRSGGKDREYTNGEITVYWKPSKCIHVTTCYKELIEVFDPRKRPWVNIYGASTNEIIRVVNLCPTGALTFAWNDEEKLNHTDANNIDKSKEEEDLVEVRIMKDGPLVVKGKFKIVGSGGGELRQMKMASFCRCGKSKKMPFCDGTHRKIGFTGD